MREAEQIRAFIVSNFLFDDPSALPDDECSLLESGIIDSTGVLDMIMFMEETFDLSVADEDVTPENFDSIARLTAYAQARRSPTRLRETA